MEYYKKNFYVLAFCICMAATSYQLIIPFLPKFLGEMDLNTAQISFWTGVIFSFQSFAFMLATPIWGKIGDTYGRKMMIIRAGTVISIMYVALYFCKTPYQLLIVRFMNGLFTGFIPASIALISTNTPKHNVLKLVAAAQSISAIGQVAGPSIGGFLSSLYGFKNSALISGGLVLFSTILVAIYVKEINKPENVEKTNIFSDIKEIINKKDAKNMLFLCFMQGFSAMSIMPFVLIHLSRTNANIPDWVIGIIYSFPAIAMISSAQKWTQLGCKHSYFKILNIALIGIGASLLFIALNNNIIWFSTIFFIFGLFTAAIVTNVTANTVSNIDPDHRGRVLSLQGSFTTLGAMVAPITVGIIAKFYSTNISFLVVGIIILISSFIFLKISKK